MSSTAGRPAGASSARSSGRLIRKLWTEQIGRQALAVDGAARLAHPDLEQLARVVSIRRRRG